MRFKLLIVFLVSSAVIFVIRAYGDYTTGGFPTYSLMDFLYWTFLYSLIPLLPAFFVFQIISPPKPQSKQNANANRNTSNNLLHSVGKVVITILATIIGMYAGFWIGLLIKPGEGGLDFGGGPYGAFIGAASGLLLCWYFFTMRNKV